MSTSWIPEPPTTPAELAEARTENAHAIRLQALLAVAGAALFALFAGVYDLGDRFTLLGRDNDITGLFERIDGEYVERADQLRDTPIVWFVGASIVKQAIDEPAVNQALEDAGSPWRVRKHGFARGAPILAAGMVERLPIKPGDLVVGAAWFSNFRDDWMVDNDSAEALIPHLMDASEILQLSDISLQDRLELCLVHPSTFFLIRDEWNRGLRRTWNHRVLGYRAPEIQEIPRVNRGRHPQRFGSDDGFRGGGPQIEGALVFDDDHVNVVGLRRMRERALAAGAAFAVLELPLHSEAKDARMTPQAVAQWAAWDGPPGIPLTQVPGTWPDALFFDYQHFNAVGRIAFQHWLVPALVDHQLPAETPQGWTGPALPRPEGL